MIATAGKTVAFIYAPPAIWGWAAVRLGYLGAAIFCGALATVVVIVALFVQKWRAANNPRQTMRVHQPK